MYEKGKEMLESLGFHRYEISNYAKEGHESRHNLNYWNNGEYVGLGLNSHSAMHIDKACCADAGRQEHRGLWQ